MKNLKEKSIEDFKINTPEVVVIDDQQKKIKGGYIIVSDTDII